MKIPIEDELKSDILSLKPEIYKFKPPPDAYEQTTPDRWELVVLWRGENLHPIDNLDFILDVFKNKFSDLNGKVEKLTYWIYIDWSSLEYFHTMGVIRSLPFSAGPWESPDTVDKLIKG